MTPDGRGPGPPTWATRLIERLLAPGPSRDGLLGDMEERFNRRAHDRSLRRARLAYAFEALESVGRYGLEAVRTSSTGRGKIMGRIWKDIHFAWRSAHRRPGFTALVVGTLALSIALNSAVFSVVHALLLEPLPYPTQDRLVMADQRDPESGFRAAVSMPNYEDWRERNTVFDAVAMERPTSFRIPNEGGTDVLEGRYVLGEFFELFGTAPALGRLPTAAELGPGAEAIAVLTHGLWVRNFGSDPAVIGADLELDGRSHQVVAVLPRGFSMDSDVALYVPMGLRFPDPAWDDRETSYGGWVVARLRPSATVDEARADMARVARDMRDAYGPRTSEAAVFSMREWYVGDVSTPILLLMAGVLFVLVVACANVASFLLGRAEERRGELAVRVALGASRGQVFRQLLTESLVFGLAAGVLGLVLAYLAMDALLAVVGATLPPAFTERVGLDGTVALATLSLSLLAAVAFGLSPAIRAVRPSSARTIREGSGLAPGTAHLRGLLISGEVALSVVLLVCTGLLVSSVNNLQTADTGFSAQGVQVQRVSAPRDRYPTRDERAQVLHEIRDRVEELPGVESAALSNLYPFSRTNWEMRFRQPSTWPAEPGESVLYTAATSSYFDVFSISLLRGRLFGEQDVRDSEPVVLIDESAAERYWPGQDPIGRRIAVDDVPEGDDYVPLWRTVVGVVGHVRNYELSEPSRIEAYVPLAQSPACCSTLWLTVKTSGDPAAMAAPVRSVIGRIDPEIATYRVDTMEGVVEAEMAMHRAVQKLFTIFGFAALLIGAIGISGIVASNVVRRRREIAVRVALGASPRSEARSVAIRTLRWVAAGTVVGLVGAALAGHSLRALLVDISPMHPPVLLGAAGVLMSAAVVAAWLPARGAAKVDPVTILRE